MNKYNFLISLFLISSLSFFSYSKENIQKLKSPHPPLNFHVSINGLREVTITWSSPYDKAKKYFIERSEKEKGPFEIIAKVSPNKKKFIDTGSKKSPLKDDHSYYYRMYAISSNKTKSDFTVVKKSHTAPPPIAPINIIAKANKSKGIFLIWETVEPSIYTKYIIERKLANSSENFEKIATVKNINFYQDGGTKKSNLTDSTEYIYQIIAVNKVDAAGDPSKPVIIKTLPPPASVKNFKAVSGEIRQISLSWESNKEDNIDGYIIYRKDSENEMFKEIASLKNNITSYIDKSKKTNILSDNHKYFYKIIAFNNVGSKGLHSEIIEASTRPIPPKVINFKAASGQPRKVTLEWDMSKDEKVIGYEIWRTHGSAPFIKIAELNQQDITSYIDKDLKKTNDKLKGKLLNSEEYQYKIFAINEQKIISEESEIIIAKTKSRPTPPKIVESEWDEGKIKINFEPSKEEDIIKYVIEVARGLKPKFKEIGSLSVIENESPLSFIDENAEPDKINSYRVKAIDKDDLHSEWSDVKAVMKNNPK
ncbi:hypothetical protein BVX93_01845 [bacterium B13(2017)]|nr:hypothetical protein BVX93_01845 [bacterium B13(2017)]